LDPKLRKVINQIHDKKLKKKVEDLIENPTIEIDGKIYTGLPLETAPAGASHHHSYPSGLIEHMISSTRIALALCATVEKVYDGKVNRDLVVAGSILHDVFKSVTYIERDNGSYAMAPLAERLDHVTLGVAELVRRGFPLDLAHIVDSHMGWQHSLIGPRTVEALVVHLADMADSQLNGEVLRAAQFLLRQSMGMELNRLNATEAFEIVNSKTLQGWEGVPNAFEKIRKQRERRSAK
jgi:7,8-dihydroneopterin 2',3'-cyclic phosphate phosphodiesterase